MPEKVRMGVIGCGRISGVYLWMARQFPTVEITACADLDIDLAKAKAAEYGVPKGCGVEELLRDDRIELVLNLTTPKSHAPIALQALRQGKHTYSEKPLGINREEGRQILDEAKVAAWRNKILPFAQPIKPRLLHQPLGILGIDDPNQFVAHLELQFIVPSDVSEKLAQSHIVQIDAEHLLERGQGLVRNDIDARALAEVEQDGFQRDIVQVNRNFLLKHLAHRAFCGIKIE